MNNQEYFELNKQSWDQRTRAHADSSFYDNDSFLKGRNTLSKAEIATLGDVSGKSIIHLQCHFGQDTMSLARMGASTIGIDFSGEAIKLARQLNEQLGLNTRFIECNVLDTLSHVNETFDIVFVSFGATCWLPELEPWAKIVSTLLKPGGFLYYHEFHPTFYLIDEKTKLIGYPYFNTGAMVEESSSSYTDNAENLDLKEVFWSHSMSELIMSLLNVGLHLDLINEYDFSPYNCFENMEERGPRQFVMEINGIRLPHTVELVASKPLA